MRYNNVVQMCTVLKKKLPDSQLEFGHGHGVDATADRHVQLHSL